MNRPIDSSETTQVNQAGRTVFPCFLWRLNLDDEMLIVLVELALGA